MQRRRFLEGLPMLFAAPAPAVERWAVVTVGNLSRNSYWGESNAKPYRDVLCTCTLIAGKGFNLVVDPSVADKAGMARELDRRTGLKLDDITAVFLTHDHDDHFAGLEHFQKAAWLAAPPVADLLNRRKQFSRKLDPAPARLFDLVDVIPTPGHTPTHHSLRFASGGRVVVVSGDAVMTQDFFRDRRAFFNAMDAELSVKTMKKLASIANVIVPGHDNSFYV